MAVAACAPAEGRAQVRVAATSDLVHAWDGLEPLLDEQVRNADVVITFGSSGVLARQIENGAPFDLYLSADVDPPARLVDAGLAEEADLFRYAHGALAVWTPAGSPLEDLHPGSPADLEGRPEAALDLLMDPRVRRIAVANPEHAPYWRLTAAAVTAAGLDEELGPGSCAGKVSPRRSTWSGRATPTPAWSPSPSSPQDRSPTRDAGRGCRPARAPLAQGGVVLAGADHLAAVVRAAGADRERSIRDHRALVDALEARDAQRAAEIMAEHIAHPSLLRTLLPPEGPAGGSPRVGP